MTIRKNFLLSISVVIFLAAIYFLTRPYLFVRVAGENYLTLPARPGLAVSDFFIHSVQKTPVLENLVIDDEVQGFTLLSTKYQSFGVGLPFLPEEGNFRQEGDYYIMDDMNRHYSSLSFRVGVGTQLTLYVDEVKYPLYEEYAPGTEIDVFIAPLYHYFW